MDTEFKAFQCLLYKKKLFLGWQLFLLHPVFITNNIMKITTFY